MNKRQIKFSLFFFPTSIMLLTLIIIFIISNVFIHQYIKEMNSPVIEEEFEVYNSSYDENYVSPESELSPYESPVTVYDIILDEKYEPVYPPLPWESDEEEQRIVSIVEYFQKNPTAAKRRFAQKVHAGHNTYYVKSKVYLGEFVDYNIVKTDLPQNQKEYVVIIYTNITDIQNFSNRLNQVLLLLIIGSAILSAIAFFWMARRIDTALDKLKTYILKVGKREDIPCVGDLHYAEFNEVAKTVNDMSAMIDKAEESQKLFFQNASHELRTPLMSILGYAEGIYSGVMKDEKKASHVILRESKKMSDLVDEILFLSRMDTQSVSMNIETLDIKELLYDCSWQVKGSADLAGISIHHHFDDHRMYIQGDEQLLERAFTNILSNAVRYAKSEIRISCATDRAEILIEIADDGEGIDPKDLPYIFQRFYKGKKGNLGIGLSMTKEIITQHNGSIEATSSKGALFSVRLPLEEK